jgi:hypothetical protein
MIQELAHRIDPLLARRTSWHNDAFTALRDRWRVLYKMAEVVPLDFLLYGAEQFGLEHTSPRVEETGRQDIISRRAVTPPRAACFRQMTPVL